MRNQRRWTRVSAAVVVAAGLLVGSVGTAQAADTDSGAVVWTDSGPVRGTVTPQYRTFQGIPFAAAPVGELRWKSPQPPARWSAPKDATKLGNVCAQDAGGGQHSTEEDCLNLNVTTPRSADRGRPKPVMVWLHGGGNSYGFGGGFNAQRLATGGDVVVVTVNYRLGLFGFLAHPALAGSGGFGLEDQQAALRWVRRNAAAFGGDAGRVTLFGESGGAFDVCGQLTAPAAAGLFHRAIMQSGACTTNWPLHGLVPGSPPNGAFLPLATVQARDTALVAELGCPDPATAADCLRQIPAAKLTQVQRGPTPIAYGTPVLPASPARALAEGRFHRVPVLSGTTRDEGRIGGAFGPDPFTEQAYQQLLREAFGDQAPRVAAKYPSSAHGSPALAWFAVATDRTWTCHQLTDDRQLARWTPTYGYEFADRQAPQVFPFPPGFPAGAYHSSELAYLFDLGFDPKFTPEQQRLAADLIGYWTRFAATGDPNRHGLPTWSRLRDSTVQSLAPGSGGIKPVDISAEHQCGFWATV